MRGCFQNEESESKESEVLPAYAGMFPVVRLSRTRSESSPRVCGDVSVISHEMHVASKFSPRMRGCFPELLKVYLRIVVLPAYAGMFP